MFGLADIPFLACCTFLQTIHYSHCMISDMFGDISSEADNRKLLAVMNTISSS